MDLSNQADVRKIVEGCADRNAEYQQFLYKTLYSKMMVVCQRYANRPEDAKDFGLIDEILETRAKGDDEAS